MGYQVELSIHRGYLGFEVSGDRSTDETERLYRRIAHESAARNVYNVLLAFNLKGRLSTFEIHDVVSNYRECGLGDEHKIAVVDKNRKTAMDQGFAEDVAQVRGLNAAVFTNEADALSWLLS